MAVVAEDSEEVADFMAAEEGEEVFNEEDIVAAIEAVVGVSPPTRSREVRSLLGLILSELSSLVTSWLESFPAAKEAFLSTTTSFDGSSSLAMPWRSA